MVQEEADPLRIIGNDMAEPDYIAAHKHSIRHREEIMRSEVCGCSFCLRVFAPARIDSWWDKDQTAVCPYCRVDSVIGSASGFPITTEFLSLMEKHWFGVSV
jgi:hypothetical protein